MPRLRILAGPSIAELVPIEANSDKPLPISSDAFEGQIAVCIKGFLDPDGKVGNSHYFDQSERKDVTWSIQVQGKFLQTHSADDILFGNAFDHPLNLPWGFSAALAFMQYVDPTLEQDLASQSKPWALSPLIATMPHFAHTRVNALHKISPFPPIKPLEERTSELCFAQEDGREPVSNEITNRRSYFQNVENRRKVRFGPEDVITTDFCYGYLQFSPDGVTLRIPGGITIDMMKHWDGQAVRFICCERIPRGETVDGNPWGRVLWCVAIEAVDEDEELEGEGEGEDDVSDSQDTVD